MNLKNSDLVLYAFQNGNQGDIFIQKSPSATFGNLVEVLKEIFNSKIKLK